MEITFIQDTERQVIYAEDLIEKIIARFRGGGSDARVNASYSCDILLTNGNTVAAELHSYTGGGVLEIIKRESGIPSQCEVIWHNFQQVYNSLREEEGKHIAEMEKEEVSPVKVVYEKPKYDPIERKIKNICVQHSVRRRTLSVELTMENGETVMAEQRYYSPGYRNGNGPMLNTIKTCLFHIRAVLSGKTGKVEYYTSATKLANHIMSAMPSNATTHTNGVV